MGKESEYIVGAWKSGDAQEMESVLSRGMAKEPGMSSVWDKLLYERNKNMAIKMENFLTTTETWFVVVGAGHLVGDRGIVELLRARGYAVNQQ